MEPVTRRQFLATGSAAVLVSGASLAATAQVRSVASDPEGDHALEVGVARRDVTPEPGQQLWGYLNPEQIATATRDPLYCRVVVLKVGGTVIGLTNLDMGRMPERNICDRVRAKAKELGIDEVIFTATHTHSGPYMELPDLPHVPAVEQAMVEGLHEAVNSAQPATLRAGRTTIDISHNRRFIKEGVCYMRWRNEERAPTSPIDHEAGLLRFDAEKTGKPIVTLVHFACHPVIFGPDNLRYSADWPGEMCSAVREATGGECVFLQGGAGDINPYLDKTPVKKGADDAVVSEGTKAADAVLGALGELAPVDGAAIAYREEPVTVGTRWDFADPGQTTILEENYGLMYEKYMKGLPADFAVPLGTLLLNNKIALSFMPGELFVDFQLDLKRRSPIEHTFLCGYANEFHLYFPTVRDITYGGYGAATVSYVGVGAGERLVTRATSTVGEMIGKIGPLEGPQDFVIYEL